MFVSALMSSPAVTVTTDTPIKTAARLLRDREVAAAPVVDTNGALVGIVSEIDLLRGAVPDDPAAHVLPIAVDPGPPPVRVEDVMTREVEVLLPHSDVADAARAMRASGVRSLPVVDGDTVVGIVSRSDLLGVLAREDDEIAREVRAALADELGPRAGVEVDVVDGIVTVTVTVTGAGPSALAASLLVAARVPGVVRVRSAEQEG